MSSRSPSPLLPWATFGVLLLLSTLVGVAVSAGSRDEARPLGLDSDGLDGDGGELAGVDGESTGGDSRAATPGEVGALQAASAVGILTVHIDTHEVGRLIPPRSHDAAPFALRLGRQVVTADVRYCAGPRTVSRTRSDRNLAILAPRSGGGEFCRIVESDGDELRARDAVVVSGAVVRADDGCPVEGARVWVGQLDEQGQPDMFVANLAGQFEATVPYGSAGMPIVVQAPGYASRFVVVDGASKAGITTRIALEKAVPRTFQLGATVPNPADGQLDLIPDSMASAMRHYPFFWRIFEPGMWSLDADGACTVEDLPGDGVVRATVRHAALAMVREVQVPLTTRPAVVASTVLISAASPRRLSRSAQGRRESRRMALFQCRVVSAVDGKPIAGARAVFDAAGLGAGSRNAVRASGWLLPRSSHQRVRSAEADHVGDVSLTVFARPGRDVVRVEAPGFCSVEIPVSDAMPAHLALPAADVFPAHWADESASAESELRFAFEAKGRLVRLRTGTANRPRWHEVVDVEGFVWPFVGPRLVDVSVELLADEGSPPVERVFSSFAVVGESTVELR